MLAIDEAKLPPPRPAVAAIRQNTQYGVVGSLHGVRESSVGISSSSAADDRPVAAAELRHRERVGQPQQRADQVGQRDQQEQLLRRERRSPAASRSADETLQISQTEKPRCSAKIDQTRLRRATLRPRGLPELGVLGVASRRSSGACGGAWAVLMPRASAAVCRPACRCGGGVVKFSSRPPARRTKSPDRSAVGALLLGQTTRTFSACGPLGPCATSNSTFWFSSSDL